MPTIKMTTQDFKDKVFNYDQEKDWKYQGSLPAIIDFYADWCGPCKMVAPVLEELADEYDGRLLIYKVDTDVEQELSSVFGIQSTHDAARRFTQTCIEKSDRRKPAGHSIRKQ